MIKPHQFKRFNWSMMLIRNLIKKRVADNYDANIIITGRRGKGKSTWAYKFLYGFEDFNPDKEICYTREKMNDLLTESGGYAHADEGVVNFSRGNTTTKGNKELYELLTKNRDNNKITTWCIPSIENVDRNILQYCCMWIHVENRGTAVVFLPQESSIFEKDKWNIDSMKKQYDDFLKKAKPKDKFAYWKFPIFRGWIKFGDLPKYQREKVEEIKKRDKNLNTKKKEEEKIGIPNNSFDLEIKTPLKVYAQKVAKGEIIAARQLDDLLEAEGYNIISSKGVINTHLKRLTGGKTLSKVFV